MTLGSKLTCVAVVGLVTLVGMGAAESETPRSREPGTLHPESTWTLYWDDDVDGILGEANKRAQVQLTFREDRVNGAFTGPVLGRPRDAIFTGEVIRAGGTPVILLQQLESGYCCTYQLQRRERRVLEGVWCDTEGRRGDVLLRRNLPTL